MKKIIFLGFVISSFSIFGQQTVNNYKYVVVANKFDFLKKVDQYKTSSLTKFLFNKYGFTSFLNTEDLPQEIRDNRCSSLFATIKDASSMLTTKVYLVLKDCNDKVIYESPIGKSKEKDYQKSFHEAIRNAFKNPIINNYTFEPQNSVKKAIVNVAETPKVLPKVNKFIAEKKVVNTPIITKAEKPTTVIANILYAQAIENGFQLVDTTPKLIFKVLKTKQENLFIIENKNGILYKMNAKWVAEFYENNVLVQKEYQVKF